MRPFELARAETIASAVAASNTGTQFIAGGTTLVDLMKLDVMRPVKLIDINKLAEDRRLGRIEIGTDTVWLGALVRMSEASADDNLAEAMPALVQALDLAASQQLRNMASLGGNVLQRTRCPYFRDPSWKECNKREPGSGCAAIDGFNRMHAVLGVSEFCIAAYPGDWAQALIALDAEVQIRGTDSERTIPFGDLHRRPGTTPDVETGLAVGDLILGFRIPRTERSRRSVYVKVRDRESYEFAVASAAVALDLDRGTVRSARIALGGVATVPWRAVEAEHAIQGKSLDEDVATAAGQAAFAGARSYAHNAFKIPLGKATLVRALLEAKAMEI